MRWKYVPETIRMDKVWWKQLKGDPYKWWVYFGTIPPQNVVVIFDIQQKRIMMPDEIEKIRALELRRGEHLLKPEWVLFEDALLPAKNTKICV